MANFTGLNVVDAGEISKYQPDTFNFGIASGDSKVTHFLSETNSDILRNLRAEWWPTYKMNVFTDITILNTVEMDNTKINLDQFKRAGVYLFLYKQLCTVQ